MTYFIIKYRWFIIGISIALFAGFGLLIPNAQTDPEIRNYVPASMKSRMETDRIENEFGVQDMIVILFSDSCILSESNLRRIKSIDNEIARMKGISDRISPFTAKTIKSENGIMVPGKLIRKIPVDSSEIRHLADAILNDRFASEAVFSNDLTTASITATINKNEPETLTLSKIDSLLNAHPGKAKILKGGLPYIRLFIMKDVRKDGILLVPAALLIMLIILKLTLREWKSVLMPFSVVVISTVISLGMIPMLGWKMSILTLLVPIILVAVANNYGIYLVARYQETSVKNRGVHGYSIVSDLLGSLNMPILFSGLTTVAGILGLLTHSVIPAKQVGVLAATGVTIALVLSLLLIPALIYMRRPSLSISEKNDPAGKLFYKLLTLLSRFINNNSRSILISSAIITVLISTGIFFVKTDTNQENYFPRRHPVRLASETINSKFGGSQTISVMITGDIKSPEVMNGIDNITNHIGNMEGVGKVFSITRVVREMSKAIYDEGEAEYGSIPGSKEGIAQLFELYNMSGDQGDFSQIMNLDNSKAQILIKLSDAGNPVISKVKLQISELAKFIPAEVTVGGYAIIMSDFAESLIRGQLSSLFFALVTVFILLAIIFRSVKGGLIGSIPLGGSILILFGFMGLTGIALDGATALLSSIMIGVGVDFTIQYVWCYNSFLRKGLNCYEATAAAIQTIGRSIIINAVSVMAGFSALILSGFTSIRFFGYLVLISIGTCLIGAIIVIPAFLLIIKPRFVEKDLLKTKIRRDEKSSDSIPVPAAAVSGSSTTA